MNVVSCAQEQWTWDVADWLTSSLLCLLFCQVTLTGQKLDADSPGTAGRPYSTPSRANSHRSPATGGMQRTTPSSSRRVTATGDQITPASSRRVTATGEHATPSASRRVTGTGDHTTPSASRRVTGTGGHTTPSASRRVTGAGENTTPGASRHATPSSSRRVTASGDAPLPLAYERTPGVGDGLRSGVSQQQQGYGGSNNGSRTASPAVRSTSASRAPVGSRNGTAGVGCDGPGNVRKREADWSPAAAAAPHSRTSGAGSHSNYQLRNSSGKGAGNNSSIGAQGSGSRPATAGGGAGLLDDDGIEVEMVEGESNRVPGAGGVLGWELSEGAGGTESNIHVHGAGPMDSGAAQAATLHRNRDGDRIPDAHSMRTSSGGGGAGWGKGGTGGAAGVGPAATGSSGRLGAGKGACSPTKNRNISLRSKQPGAL